MKTMNSLIITALLMLFATGAYSANYDFGTLDGTPKFQNVSVAPGKFLDVFEFNVATNSSGASNVSNHTLEFYGTDVFNITGLTLEIYNAGTLSLLTMPYDSIALSAGDYIAQVSGLATGVAGGNYTYSAIAAPVPEASTLSLMLAGFGLVGFMSYRRRNLV